MAKISLEEKEQQLKILAEKIKEEKRKINEQLGKDIISTLGLKYGSIDRDKTNEICNILKNHYASATGMNNEQSL